MNFKSLLVSGLIAISPTCLEAGQGKGGIDFNKFRNYGTLSASDIVESIESGRLKKESVELFHYLETQAIGRSSSRAKELVKEMIASKPSYPEFHDSLMDIEILSGKCKNGLHACFNIEKNEVIIDAERMGAERPTFEELVGATIHEFSHLYIGDKDHDHGHEYDLTKSAVETLNELNDLESLERQKRFNYVMLRGIFGESVDMRYGMFDIPRYNVNDIKANCEDQGFIDNYEKALIRYGADLHDSMKFRYGTEILSFDDKCLHLAEMFFDIVPDVKQSALVNLFTRRTPRHYTQVVLSMKRVEVLERIVEKNGYDRTDLGRIFYFKNTPLGEKVFRALVDLGYVPSREHYIKTVLNWSFVDHGLNLEMYRYMTQNGLDMNKKIEFRKNEAYPLQVFLYRNERSQSYREENIKAVRMMMASGVKGIHEKIYSEIYGVEIDLIEYCALGSNLNCVNFLLEEGIKVDRKREFQGEKNFLEFLKKRDKTLKQEGKSGVKTRSKIRKKLSKR